MSSRFEVNPRPTGRQTMDGFYDMDGEEPVQFFLFQVKAMWQRQAPVGGVPSHHFSEVYVLAADEQGARDQALCALDVDRWITRDKSLPPVVDGSVTTVAERVPFVIRGWGNKRF